MLKFGQVGLQGARYASNALQSIEEEEEGIQAAAADRGRPDAEVRAANPEEDGEVGINEMLLYTMHSPLYKRKRLHFETLWTSIRNVDKKEEFILVLDRFILIFCNRFRTTFVRLSWKERKNEAVA
jgi:hypothetical protein